MKVKNLNKIAINKTYLSTLLFAPLGLLGWVNLINTPFYEYKVNSYEGGISAPFIASWPKQINKMAGQVYHTTACLPDIMPTFI
jgi:arylsulfatase